MMDEQQRINMKIGQHPFIVRLRYALQTPTHLVFIFDRCYPLIGLVRGKSLEESHLRVYLAELLIALKYLIDNHLPFLNTSPDSVLLNQKGASLLSSLSNNPKS